MSPRTAHVAGNGKPDEQRPGEPCRASEHEESCRQGVHRVAEVCGVGIVCRRDAHLLTERCGERADERGGSCGVLEGNDDGVLVLTDRCVPLLNEGWRDDDQQRSFLRRRQIRRKAHHADHVNVHSRTVEGG